MSEAVERWIQGLPLNAQFRDELRGFVGDHVARLRALGLTLALGAALLLAWPASAVLDLAQGPFTYRAIGSVAVLIVAYLALVWGTRVHPAGGKFTVQEWAAFVPLAPGTYLRGAWAGQLAEPVFFILLATPVLVPGAMIVGATATQFGALLTILLGTAITGRLGALALTLWLEHRRVGLIVAAHGAWAGMFALGWVAWGPLSPLAAFHDTLGGGILPAGPAAWLTQAWPGFLLTHAVLDGALFALAWWRVRLLRGRGDDKAVAG